MSAVDAHPVPCDRLEIFALKGFRRVYRDGRRLCDYFFGRGQRAMTVVPSPPRGRNTPRTSAHFGFVHFTTSFNIWFTTFSWKIPRLRYSFTYSFNDLSSKQCRSGM